jgi:hypothetical protein
MDPRAKKCLCLITWGTTSTLEVRGENATNSNVSETTVGERLACYLYCIIAQILATSTPPSGYAVGYSTSGLGTPQAVELPEQTL